MNGLVIWGLTLFFQTLSLAALSQDLLAVFILTHLVSIGLILYQAFTTPPAKITNMYLAAVIFTIFIPCIGAGAGLLVFRLLEYAPPLGDPVTKELDQYVIAENEFARRIVDRNRQHALYIDRWRDPWNSMVEPAVDAVKSNDIMSKTKVIRRLFAAPTFEACQLIRKFMYSDSHTERYLCLTTTSSKIREWSEELESLTKIVEQDPTNSRNLFELAGKYLGIGKFNLLPDPINQEYLENAYQHSLQLLELEPNNLEALKLAAKAAVLTNRYETAIRILRSTDYTETSSFSYWFWLLECYFHVGDIRSVLAICEKFKTRELECPVKFRPHIHFWLRYVKNHYYHQTAS